MNELKRMLKLFNKKSVVLVMILTIITTGIGVIIPYTLGYIIDNISEDILYLLLVLFILYLIQFIITIVNNHIVINITENTIYKLRKKVFNKLQYLPLKYFDKNDTGNIMSVITNDIDNINECLSEGITTITGSIITFIGVTIMMIYINVLLSIIVIITVPLFFIIVAKMSKKMNEYFLQKQNLLGSITSDAEEIVGNVKNIKEINKEIYFSEQFDKKNNSFKNISIKANLYSYLILPINLIINNLSNILIIGVGLILVLKGQIKIGGVIAFISYASMFREPINDIAMMMGTISESVASLKRIFHIVDYKCENKKGEKFKINGSIEFKNVNFKYEDKTILSNISFKIEKNHILSIVGETGSGKTTLVNLIEKFYEVKEGSIYIDNIDIQKIDSDYLRSNIGLVLQETHLFKGTIMENIKYGVDVDDKKIIKICKKIKADIFIEKLKDGYYTEIDNDSTILSTGEKQLISIIRCIIKNPQIIILDEATSEVDVKTEKLIYDGIKYLLKNRTCIIIAHRLSTTKNSDNILVLKEGKIIEFGSHNQLINQKNEYYNMYNKQIN